MSDGLSQQASRPPKPSGGVVSAVVNWLARVKPATAVRTVGRFLIAFPKLATTVRLAPFRLLSVQKPAVSAVRASFDLVHKSYVATAAQDAGGTGTWNNPTFIQGQEQGTQAGSATFSGGLVLGTGKLRGTLVTQPTRGTLIIDEVWLRFHYQTTGLPVVSDLISQLALGYRVNTAPVAGADKDVVVVTSNDNYLVAGREFRIDNGAGAFTDVLGTAVTWANITLIQPYFSATTILNGLMTYHADAVRLRVVAHTVYT